MLKRILLSLEDPEKPLLGPNIWMLKKIGLLLPDDKIEKFAYICVHELATWFVISQFMELYTIRSNLDLVITNLKISMLSIVCVVKANTSVLWQKNWHEVIDYVTVADKEERDDVDRTRAQILESYTKYCRKITYLYWFLVFTTFLTVTTTPLLKYLTEMYFETQTAPEDIEEFYHIFSSWMPFEKNHGIGSWITVMWHTTICAYGATIVAAFDVTAMVIMVFFGGKLDLTRERCKQMMGVGEKGLTEEEATKIFRKMHRTHILMMK